MRLTNKDRQIVREWVDLYSRAPLYPLGKKNLERTRRWAYGETMTEIAINEDVGVSRISHSVTVLTSYIKEFKKLRN